MGRKPPRVPFTAHSSESFSVQGRDGGFGSLRQRIFGSFFVCKINWLGAREGCGRLFLLGGFRVDLAGILRSDDCCRPSTGEVLIGRQGHASWSVEPREAFEGPQGRGVGAGENYCGGRRILGGSQPDPRGDLGGRGGGGDLAGHIGGQVLDRARLSRVQQVIHVPQ